MAMLEIRDLNVYYGGIHALKGISLEVSEGQIVSMIGSNGAGKSSMMNAEPIMDTICPSETSREMPLRAWMPP